MMLVLDSGLAVDLEQVKKTGCRAVLAGFLGVLFPVVFAIIVVSVFWGENWKVGLSAGAALAPTSLGFSVELLSEVNQLNTPSGQLICTAAVIDDVLSLLLLAEVQALQDENIQAWGILKPIVASIGSVVVGIALTVLLLPLLPRLRKHIPNARHQQVVYNVSLVSYAGLFAWLSGM